MTLGDGWAVHSRGDPQSLMVEIVNWRSDDDILDLIFANARLFKKSRGEAVIHRHTG
jgi:hypothetical protein